MEHWPDSLVSFLRQVTRECVFDWVEVSRRVAHYAESLSLASHLEITPQSCREAFASTHVVKVPESNDKSLKELLPVEHLHAMPLGELIQHVEERESIMRQRKETIFQRVLQSLGGDHAAVSNHNHESDEAVRLFLESQQRKDDERRRTEERHFESRERERLEAEREMLRRRFEPDSRDAEGENPLSEVVSLEEITSFEQIDVSFDQWLGGDDFEIILSELEKELDAQAVDKEDGASLSELGEILNFLDQEAASNSLKKSSTPQKKLNRSGIVPPTPVREDISRAALDLKTAFGLVALPQAPSAAETMPCPPPQLASTTSLASEPKRIVDNPPLAVPPKTIGTRIERTQTRDRHRAPVPDENEDDEDEEDDDVAWRKKRMSAKKLFDSSEVSFSAQKSFWGAFGSAGPAQDVHIQVQRESEEDVMDVVRQVTEIEIQRELDKEDDDEAVGQSEDQTDDSVEAQSQKNEKCDDEGISHDITQELFEEPVDMNVSLTSVLSLEAESASPVMVHSVQRDDQSKESGDQVTQASSAVSGSFGGGRRERSSRSGKGGLISQATRTNIKVEREVPFEKIANAPDALSDLVSVDPSAVDHHRRSEAEREALQAHRHQQEQSKLELQLKVQRQLEEEQREREEAERQRVEEERVERERAAAEMRLQQTLSLGHCGHRPTTPLRAFPVDSFSDKISGIVINCGVDDQQQSAIDLSLDNVLCVSISQTDAQRVMNLSSEVLVMRVCETIINQCLASELQLIGLWQSSTLVTGVVWRLVFAPASRSSRNIISSAYWKESWSVLSLNQLLAHIPRLSPLLSDSELGPMSQIIRCADFFNEKDEVLTILQEIRECEKTDSVCNTTLAHYLNMSEEVRTQVIQTHPLWSQLPSSLQQSLTHSCSLTFHDYMLTEPDALPSTLLSELVCEAELRGLRLVGMRLGHVSMTTHSLSSLTLKRTSDPSAVHRSLSLSATLLPLLTIAFVPAHAQNISPQQNFASTIAKHSYGLFANAGDALRSLLGPEDPVVSKQTDPNSLRARYAESRERSLCYTPAVHRDKQTSDLAWWFTGRASAILPTPTMHPISLLSIPNIRTVHFVVNLQTACEIASHTYLSRSFTQLQLIVCQSMQVFSQSLAVSLLQCQTLSQTATAQFQRESTGRNSLFFVSTTPSDESTEQQESQCLVWTFATIASDLALRLFWDELIAGVTDVCSKCQSIVTVRLAMHMLDDHTLSAIREQGSRLNALEAQRVIAKEDLFSHEDVGLDDVVILRVREQLSPCKCDGFLGIEDRPKESALDRTMLIVSLFPQPCQVTTIAAQSQLIREKEKDSNNIKLFLEMEWVLRGYQILENLDHCLSVAQSLTGRRSPDKHKSLKTFAENTHTPVASLVHAYFLKGSQALERIFTQFALSSIFTSFSINDLVDFVPRSSMTALSPGLVQALSLRQGMLAQEKTVSDVSRALFPPSAFHSIATLCLPWPRAAHKPTSTVHSLDARNTRVLSRAVRRAEREGFIVLAIQTVEMRSEDLNALVHDNAQAFPTLNSMFGSSISESEQVSACENKDNHRQMTDDETCVVTILLLSHTAALFRLKSMCGPVCDIPLALTQYPRSLSAVLADLSLTPSTTSMLRDPWPALLPSTTVQQTERLVSRYLPQCVTMCERIQEMPVTSEQRVRSTATDGLESSEADHELQETIWIHAKQCWAVDEGLVRNLKNAKNPLCHVQLKAGGDHQSAEVLLRDKNTGIAALVLTRSLIREKGLGAILEALQREGLWVTNLSTMMLNMHAAKHLLEAAGASSLTLRPTISRMVDGPVVCVGVCGPMHSFVRLKSFTVDSKSPSSLWTLNSTKEYVVLASSSTSLSMELYCLCFDKIFGEDSPYTITTV